MPDAGELNAIAQAGTAGAQAYKQAQATLAAQQQAALQAALQGNLAQSASPEGQAQLANTISQGYRPQQAALAQNQAGMEDWFARTGQASKDFIDRANAIVPVIEAQLAGKLGSGGGGGGGGGGSGRSSSAGAGSDDWMKNLKAAYGTTAQGNIESALLAEAHANRDKTMPVVLQAQKIGVDKYGIPKEIVGNYVKPGGFYGEATKQLGLAKTGGVNYQRFAQDTRKAARQAPGNQAATVRYVLAQAKQELPQKKKRRRG